MRRLHSAASGSPDGCALLVERECCAGELARAIQCFYQRHGLKCIFEVRRQGGSRPLGEGLQSAHGSHEGVREVVAADREGVPAKRVRAALSVFGGIWRAGGIVEVDAHRDACCAPEPLPLNKTVLALGTEVVVVVGGNKDAFGVAVVEDCDGLGGG